MTLLCDKLAGSGHEFKRLFYFSASTNLPFIISQIEQYSLLSSLNLRGGKH